MTTKEKVLDMMNDAAREARADLDGHEQQLDASTLEFLRKWWETHYSKAGHTRLAYILMRRPLPDER